MSAGTMPIYNMRLAGYLMQRGFVLLDMKPNTNAPHKNVFYFTDTAEVKTAISDYLQRKDKSNGKSTAKSK